MVAELGGHQFGEQPVILVGVVTLGTDHEVGFARAPELRDVVLDFPPVPWKVPVGQAGHGEPHLRGSAHRGERVLLLDLAVGTRSRQHQGVHDDRRVAPGHLQQGGSGPDRDVVAVRTHHRHFGHVEGHPRGGGHATALPDSHSAQGRKPLL